MKELGSRLRNRREERGLSLQDIERSTKISVRLLKHIEEGTFSALPKGVFARNFIRQYCEAIDMDAGPVLERLFPSEPYSEETETAQPRERSGWIWLIIVVVATICLLWYVFVRFDVLKTRSDEPRLSEKNPVTLSRSADRPLPQRPDAETISEVPDDSNARGGSALKTVKDSKPPVTQAPGNQESLSPKSIVMSQTNETEELRFEASDRCWVHLKCDGKDMDFILMGGESYTVHCNFPIVLTLGNAVNVKIYVNNTPVTLPDGERVIRDFTIRGKQQ